MLLAGAFIGGYYFRGEKIEIIEKKKIEYRTIQRDYNAPISELQAVLKCYDLGEPRLDAVPTGDWLQLRAGLCQREWTRDIKIIGTSRGGYKMYLTIAGIGTIVGGYCVYKLIR